MNRAARRPAGSPVAAALVLLVALVALTGCTSGSGQHTRASATVTDLRAKAAMAPCPTPTSLSAANPSSPSGPSGPSGPSATRSPGAPAAGTPGASTPAGPSATVSPSVAPSVSPTAEAAGQELPAETLPCLAGGPDVPLRGLTGVPLVINLWATWCLPCRAELPAFQAAFARADPSKLRILGVATEDPGLTRELSFAVDTGLHMPNLVDDKGKVAARIGVRGLPATLFVAPDGSLVHVYNGPPLTFSALRELVRTYLKVTIGG